ncbi:lectin-like protein [Empedobacter falsenii]
MNKIKFIFIAICLFAISTSAQVTLNVDDQNIEASADFQIYSQDKGFAMPQVALTNIVNYAPITTQPIEGLIVYNTTNNTELSSGLYFWSNNKWNRMGIVEEKSTIIQIVDEEYLGYKLATTAVTPPATLETAKLTTCAKWEIKNGGNGHTYCGYNNATANLAFTKVYNAAKTYGGYVVTINSDEEWDFINENIITASGKELNNAIWLGYTKLASPGNAAKYNWITGEKSVYNWGLNSSVQARFIENEPESSSINTNTRCTYILPKSINSNRQWSSSDCTTSTNHNNFIIEFSK